MARDLRCHQARSTYEDYARTVRLHIIPHLGHIKVQDLHPENVARWLALAAHCHGRPSTITLAHMHLKQALGQALDWRLVPANVAAIIKPPAAKKDRQRKQLQTWTEEEANLFLDAADMHSAYGPIWRVSLATGMRRGELLGLRWEDVAWETRELRVRQSVGPIANRPTIGPTKTDTSIRDIPVTDDLLQELRQHRIRQNERRLALGELWHDNDLVFASEVGTPVSPRNLYREYRRLVDMTHVPQIKIHGQRHTHATWAIKAGIDPKTVSERLGHDVTMTLRLYTHPDEETHRQAAQTLDEKIARRRRPPALG